MKQFNLFIMFAIFVGMIVYAGSYYSNEDTVTFTVTGKERVDKVTSEGSNDSYYLIFTDKGTFKIGEELIFGRFNTSDFYGKFYKDSTYTVRVVGWRSGALSEYPNIMEIVK